MRAAWWWIDRWRKSTAYTDMSLAAQGAYRNLLDELWLRDGLLPLDDRILAKISGGPFEWSGVRDVVLSRFIRTEDGYRNETHDAVSGEAKRRAEKQRRYRDRRRSGNGDSNAAGNDAGNVTGHVTGSPSPSPSPSPDQSQNSPPTPSQREGERESRKKRPRRWLDPADLPPLEDNA